MRFGGSRPDDLWAVGEGNTILHGDGENWLRASLPSGHPAETRLFDVWGASPDDVWIVGDSVILQRHRLRRVSMTKHVLCSDSLCGERRSNRGMRIGGDRGAGAVDGGRPDESPSPAAEAAVDAGPSAERLRGRRAGRCAPGVHRRRLVSNGRPTGARRRSPELADVWDHGGGDVWTISEDGLVLHWDRSQWSVAFDAGVALIQLWGRQAAVCGSPARAANSCIMPLGPPPSTWGPRPDRNDGRPLVRLRGHGNGSQRAQRLGGLVGRHHDDVVSLGRRHGRRGCADLGVEHARLRPGEDDAMHRRARLARRSGHRSQRTTHPRQRRQWVAIARRAASDESKIDVGSIHSGSPVNRTWISSGARDVPPDGGRRRGPVWVSYPIDQAFVAPPMKFWASSASDL